MVNLKDLLAKRIQDRFKGKPVQPPAAPPPMASRAANPFDLYVPYSMEEHPRTFLHLLATVDNPITPVPKELQDAIKLWLEGYDNSLVKWLEDHYGPGVKIVADHITQAVMRASADKVQSEYKKVEDQALRDLDKQFEEGNGGNSNGPDHPTSGS